MKEELRKAFTAGILHEACCKCGDCPLDPDFEEWFEHYTAAPFKTLQECRDIVAKKYDHKSFEDLFWSWSDGEGDDGFNGITKAYDEASEMYANQPKPVKVVTDEEIYQYAEQFSIPFNGHDSAVNACKWMRKQLTGE